MPKEKKSDREKKAVESKSKSEKISAKGTTTAAAAGIRTAKPKPASKPALTRTRVKKNLATNEAGHAAQSPDSTQSDNHTPDLISHEHISVRAYYLSEELRACGEQWDSEKIWLEAERQIRAERKGSAV